MKPKTPVSVAILIRVSPSRQGNAPQLAELSEYAAGKNYRIVEVCKETVTGDASDEDRHGLQRVEELAAAGKIEKVLVHEISRIARRNSVAHRFVETLEKHRVSLYWHAQ